MTYSKPLLLVLLLATQACAGGSAEEEKDPEGRVAVEDFQYVKLPGGARIVMGTLHNRSAELINTAQLQIALYDADNRRVGSMSVVVRNVGPDERKPFRHPVDADDAVRGARVRSVLLL